MFRFLNQRLALFMLLIVAAGFVAARPSLPPMLPLSSEPEREKPENSTRVETTEASPLPAEPAVDPSAWVRGLLHGYEPTLVGYTFQEGDEPFLDFSISLLLPLFHDRHPTTGNMASVHSAGYRPGGIYPFFAFTGRAGQYIGTRSSSPVVGKRFNPLLSLRHWMGEYHPHNYIELVGAHESNGQWIDDPATFEEVRGLRGSLNEARDEISRGWDYLGLNASWNLSTSGDDDMRLQLKLSHYFDTGPAQGDAEEYQSWEGGNDGKRRRDVDGIQLRWDFNHPIRLPKWVPPWLETDGRTSITWLTGIGRPLAYHTFEIEAGMAINKLPIVMWYRYGYMTDLTDYYRKLQSAGVRVSVWKF